MLFEVWPRSSSNAAVACCGLVLLVTMLLTLSSFLLSTGPWYAQCQTVVTPRLIPMVQTVCRTSCFTR